MARFITVPGKMEYSFDGPNGPITKGLTFRDFLKECCKDPQFIKSLDSDGFEAMDVRSKLLKGSAEPGTIMELSDREWSAINQVAKSPPYFPEVMYQLGDFMRAVRDAATKDPRPEATVAAS